MNPLTKQTKLGTLTIHLDENGRRVAFVLDTEGKTVFPVHSIQIEDWPRHLETRGFTRDEISDVVMASVELLNDYTRNCSRAK